MRSSPIAHAVSGAITTGMWMCGPTLFLKCLYDSEIPFGMISARYTRRRLCGATIHREHQSLKQGCLEPFCIHVEARKWAVIISRDNYTIRKECDEHRENVYLSGRRWRNR